MALPPEVAGAWMPEEPEEQSAVFPASPFEARAAQQQMPGGAMMDARRMKRVRVARPASGKIDWRELQKEQAAKVKNGR